jgi:outer membrane protein assembly factor BamB
MLVEERSGGGGGGCLRGLILMVLGVLLGAGLTLYLLGVRPADLLSGRSPQLPILTATVGPTEVAVQPNQIGERRTITQAALMLRDQDQREPDFVLIARNIDSSAEGLVYFEGTTQTARWENYAIGEDAYEWQIAVGADRVYVASDMRVLALNRADGVPVWEATLSDSLFSGCAGCLRLFDERIVALSQDGIVQSYDIASGQQLWSVRLKETPRQLLDVNGFVAVPDERDESGYGAALLLFDPADGKLVQKLEPQCGAPDAPEMLTFPGIYDDIHHDTERGALYWTVNAYTTCLIRIDEATGETTLQAFVSEDFSAAGLEPQNILLGETVYLSDGRHLEAVASDGTTRIVLHEEDYELFPIAEREGVLLVEAQRTRGSSRVELWALDANGQRLWQRVISGDERFMANESNGDWAVQLTASGVLLLERPDRSLTLNLTVLDLTSGTVQREAQLPIGSEWASWYGTVWDRDNAYVTLESFRAIDTAQGAWRYQWP